MVHDHGCTLLLKMHLFPLLWWLTIPDARTFSLMEARPFATSERQIWAARVERVSANIVNDLLVTCQIVRDQSNVCDFRWNV